MNLDPYKGVRDFYPEDQRVQNRIFSAMRRAVEAYGYEEMNASILEPTELYAKKSSEEIVSEQTYTFTDRGDRSVTLRPEMTPTVARMVAARKRELGYPLRWYSIQNFFRYERPQRGRLREFWQLNADLFGSDRIEADVETVAVAHRIMMELGATDSDFTIHMSDRGFLGDAALTYGVDAQNIPALVRLVDKKDKMEEAVFIDTLSGLFPKGNARDFAASMNEALQHIPASVAERIKLLGELGVNNVSFDPYLARGFDYYTGMVFEVFDTDTRNTRSMFGGGRYDNLVGHYANESVPAVGFAMGDVIARDFLETHKLLTDVLPTTHLYIAPISESNTVDAMKVADTLRQEGVRVSVGVIPKKIGDHIKAALKLGIPYFVAFGDAEKESGLLTVKTLADSSEEALTVNALSEYVRKE